MYEETTGIVTTALVNASPQLFSAPVIAAITALTTSPTDNTITISENLIPLPTGQITVAAGTEVAFVAANVDPVNLRSESNLPVLILQGTRGYNLTVDAGPVTLPSPAGHADRVVVGTSGADKIVIADARNTQVVAGNLDTVLAGGGADTIIAGLGNSTIIGGTGHAIVQMKGNAENYTVTVANGHAIVSGGPGAQTVDVSKIQYVQLDNGQALVFAKNSQEAAVTTIYETAFGRTADANGLNYWFDRAAHGESLVKIAEQMTRSTEFVAGAALSNSDFVNTLYLHTFGRAAEGDGLNYWTNALASGHSRGELIAAFSEIASHHLDGTQTQNIEAEIVGSVTIIQNIV